jgi:hypothetical protein
MVVVAILVVLPSGMMGKHFLTPKSIERWRNDLGLGDETVVGSPT